MPRHRLTALALSLLLAAALTGCTGAEGSSPSPGPTTASPSALGGTSASGSGEGTSEATISAKATAPSSLAPMAWPRELYASDGTTYADHLEAGAEADGTGQGIGTIVGEDQGEGVAEVTVQTRTGHSYSTQVICERSTPLTLTDSQGSTAASPTCDTGIGGPGDGTEVTFQVVTPSLAPVRLVVLETKDEATPDV